jgi:2,4-dienoyl-CoA reductase-like NADH-dependent reductase (Old Yellow Enzyme family)
MQGEAWKARTSAVHDRGGKIFVQLMHCGRVANVGNLPLGAEVLGPGIVVCPGEMYTDTQGMQPHNAPRAMTDVDIAHAVQEYVVYAKLALDPGFDGVELHGANGYLMEQFLNPFVNLRTDGYSGSIEGRNRLALEIMRATVSAIGRDRVGIHLVDHSSMGAPLVPAIRKDARSPSLTWRPSSCPVRRATPTPRPSRLDPRLTKALLASYKSIKNKLARSDSDGTYQRAP